MLLLILFLFSSDFGSYSSACRCSGEYVITENDLENGHNIVCCSDCTLSIRVLYNVLPEDEGADDKEKVEMENSR